jgi:hypothetical protein
LPGRARIHRVSSRPCGACVTRATACRVASANPVVHAREGASFRRGGTETSEHALVVETTPLNDEMTSSSSASVPPAARSRFDHARVGLHSTQSPQRRRHLHACASCSTPRTRARGPRRVRRKNPAARDRVALEDPGIARHRGCQARRARHRDHSGGGLSLSRPERHAPW